MGGPEIGATAPDLIAQSRLATPNRPPAQVPIVRFYQKIAILRHHDRHAALRCPFTAAHRLVDTLYAAAYRNCQTSACAPPRS